MQELLNDLIYRLYAHARERAPDGEVRVGQLGKLLVFDHPQEVDAIAKDPGTFRKNFSLISALGHSRFNTNEPEWALRRDLTQPQFLDAARPARQADVREVYARFLSRAEPERASIETALFQASMAVFLNALGMSAGLGGLLPILERTRTALKRLQYHSWVAPTPAERDSTVAEARAVVRDFGAELARDEASVALCRGFARRAESVPGFSAAEELIMNLFAGVETTAATLMWVIDRLGANEAVQARLHDELGAAEPNKTPFADCFVNETMRYFPPIPFLVREVDAPVTIGRRSLRRGQLILISIVGVHHHPDFWRDPSTFDASRAEFMTDSYDRKAFIPFLAGPRMCGGARLARLELREGVGEILRRFAFKRTGSDVRFDYGLALRPAGRAGIAVARR